MPSPSVPLSAKNAVVRVNGNVVACKVWRVDPKADPLDTTNFESGGFDDSIAGIISCDITIEFDLDSSGFQTNNPPNLAAGQIVNNVYLYTNGVGSAKWTFPTALVTGGPNDAEVRGLLKGSATMKSKGSFSFA